MRQANATRPISRDQSHDGGSWRVQALVTVRTPEGVLFGRLETRVYDATLKLKSIKKWK